MATRQSPCRLSDFSGFIVWGSNSFHIQPRLSNQLILLLCFFFFILFLFFEQGAGPSGKDVLLGRVLDEGSYPMFAEKFLSPASNARQIAERVLNHRQLERWEAATGLTVGDNDEETAEEAIGDVLVRRYFTCRGGTGEDLFTSPCTLVICTFIQPPTIQTIALKTRFVRSNVVKYYGDICSCYFTKLRGASCRLQVECCTSTIAPVVPD